MYRHISCDACRGEFASFQRKDVAPRRSRHMEVLTE